jgi:hypothetical protein
MGEEDITSKISLDSTEFKAALGIANRELRVLESGFKASAASMGDWSHNSSGLELRIKALNSEIDVQTAAITRLEKEYTRVSAEEGATSREAQNLAIKLNGARERLANMQGELSQTKTNLATMGQESANTGKKVQELDEKEQGAARSTRNFDGALQALGEKLKSVGSGLAGMASKVAETAANMAKAAVTVVAAATIAVVGLAATTVGPASDLNETISKVGTVFEGSSKQVIAFGENAYKSVGMSEQAALTAAGTYGNLFRSMEITTDKSTEMSLGLVQLAGDFASFNNLPTVEVLEKLQSGISGETEPLKSLGININAATLKAKAMAMGFSEVDGELTPAAKAQATYALIMEQSSLAQGDFARTSGGLANQQRILYAQFENNRAKLGTGLLPIIVQVVTMANKFIASDFVQGGITKLTDGIGKVSGLLAAGMATGKIDGIAASFRALGSVNPILGKVGNVISDILEKIQRLVNAFKTGGLAGLGAEVGRIIGQMIASIAEQRGQMAQAAIALLTSLTQTILDAIPTLIPIALQVVTSLVNFLLTGLPLLMESGVAILLALIDGIVPMLPTLVETALKMIITLANGLSKALPKLIPMVAKIIPQIVLVLIENLPQLILAAVQLILALANGLVAAIPILLPYVPKIVQAIVDALIQSLPLLAVAALQLISVLANGIADNLPKIASASVSIVTTLVNGIAGLAVNIAKIGKSIVDGVWDGMKANFEGLKKNVLQFFLDILNAVKKALGFGGSGSQANSFIGIGKNMADGLGVGFTSQFANVQRAINSSMNAFGAGGMNLSLSGGMPGGGVVSQQAVSTSTIYITVQGYTGDEMGLRTLARKLGPMIEQERRLRA